jgi:hypothetical protein
MESSGVYNQNQVIANVNSKLNGGQRPVRHHAVQWTGGYRRRR